MKSFITIVQLLVLVAVANAQVQIPHMFDCKGFPLYGYYDPLSYSPEDKVTFMHTSESYELGHYYDKSGQKVEGQIKFQDKRIYFKKGGEVYRDKITPETVEHVVVGLDSFFVARKYYYNRSVKTKPVYVQFIARFNNCTYAKHYNFRSVYTQGQSPIVETFLVKPDGEDTWINFSDANDFKTHALRFFGHIPVLKEKIENEKYESKHTHRLIKLAEYYDKHKKGTPILYDKYWQETYDAKRAKYHAKVVAVEGSTWTLEYYKGDQKLYKGAYYSFYPHKLKGDFYAYYPNGNTRQVTTFEKRKPKAIKYYNELGKLLTHMELNEVTNPNTGKVSIEYDYHTVNNAQGESILRKDGICSQTIRNEANGVDYFYKYKGKQLHSCFRLYKGDSVYQITNSRYKAKVKSLQKAFGHFMNYSKYERALRDNAQGVILVGFRVDEKGRVQSAKLLTSLHSQYDLIVSEYVKYPNIKFKPYKVDKVKQPFEIVIPFEFGINRFYRKPYNHYYHYHWQLHHNMMHQQMLHNSATMGRF